MKYQKSNRWSERKARIAFIERCYQLYEQKMYQVAYGILQDPGWAEDAVQDAFLKMMKGQVYFEDVCSDDCKKYIITVIRNSAIDIYNKKKKEREMFCSCDEESYREKAEIPKEDEEAEELMELISGLGSRYYEVVECLVIKDLSMKETSVRLGISEAGVRKRFERAKKMLKQAKKK